MPHKGSNRIRQRKLVRGQPRWIKVGKGWCRVVLRVETVGGDGVQEVYGFARVWKRSAGIHPDRDKIALTIERLNRGSVFRARHVLLEFARD